jgi:hypothetical protein
VVASLLAGSGIDNSNAKTAVAVFFKLRQRFWNAGKTAAGRSEQRGSRRCNSRDDKAAGKNEASSTKHDLLSKTRMESPSKCMS